MSEPNQNQAGSVNEANSPAGLPASGCSASDYNPAQCLRKEVERFKATNRFTPMDVTGFYIQAAVVLDEHRQMVEALRYIRDYYGGSGYIGQLAEKSLPMSETPRTPNDRGERPERITPRAHEKGKL